MGIELDKEDGVEDEAPQDRQERRDASDDPQPAAGPPRNHQLRVPGLRCACSEGRSVAARFSRLWLSCVLRAGWQAMAQMGKCLDPRMLKQIGGMSGLQNLMKSMNGMDMSQFMGAME